MITDFKNKVKDFCESQGSEDDSYPKGTLGRTDEELHKKTSFRLEFVVVPSISAKAIAFALLCR